MTFVQAIQSGFRNYANFMGRSRRSAFWWWVLFQFLALMVAAVLDSVIRTPLFYMLTALGLLLPALALEIRRLHDTNRSGWWVFISLVPIVGIILLIVWWCGEGTRGPNKYGVDPMLAEGVDATVFSPTAPSGDLRQG